MSKFNVKLVCTQPGKPCSPHPQLCPPSKGNRATMCKARDSVKERYPEGFKTELGLRCFLPEPQKGGNSNTSPVSQNVFNNAMVSSKIPGVPEEFMTLLLTDAPSSRRGLRDSSTCGSKFSGEP